MNSDYDEVDAGEVKPMPNFVPPEAQRAASPSGDELMKIETTAPENQSAGPSAGSLPPAIQQSNEATVEILDPDSVEIMAPDSVKWPESGNREDDVQDAVYRDVVEEAEIVEKPAAGESPTDKVELDRATFELLMGVAKKVNAGAVLVDPEELRRVNSAVEQGAGIPGAGATQGQQQVRTGAQALVEGGMSLLGGVGTLAGAVLKAGGKAVGAIAGVGGDNEAQASAGVAVLPRISEYRVDQAEKAANGYSEAMQKLWASGSLPNVRKEIEERARQTGLSVEDVMDKMKPNGEMADLADKFRSAVAASPDAQTHKKAMDKAFDGWVRQYGRGQEELLNPETDGNPHFEGLRDRLDKSFGRMQKSTSEVPLFEGEDKSHAERLREIVQRIMEKLKEIAKDFVSMVRGKGAEDDNAPSP